MNEVMYNLSLKNVSRTMYRTFQLPCPLYIVNSCELFGLWGCPLHRGPVWALRQSMWCWCKDVYILIGWAGCMWGDMDQWDVWKGETENWLALQTFMEYSDIPSAICSNTTAKFHISLRRGLIASQFLHWNFEEKYSQFFALDSWKLAKSACIGATDKI